MKWEGCGSKRS